jgi:hypothetical protein
MAEYGWSPAFVRRGITSAQSWIFYFWAIKNKSSFWGGNLVMTKDPFVAAEIKKLKRKKKANG